MSQLALARIAGLELLTRGRISRVPEPDLVMDDPSRVAAYAAAGEEDGPLAGIFFFNAVHACELIRPGDSVLDLACGPAGQLALLARLNPKAHFTGIDLSDPMLARARRRIAAAGLRNVEVRRGDMTDLREFPDGSFDVVLCTFSLHHLSHVQDLERTFWEVHRIGKPSGGVFLVDFGRLRRKRSIDYFADQYAKWSPTLFTEDKRNSMRAAFSSEDFRHASELLGDRALFYASFLLPVVVAVKSPSRRALEREQRAALARFRRALPRWQETEISALIRLFRLGGLRTPAV